MIAVALSGGVDSAFAAHLLRTEGREIFGLLALFSQPQPEKEIARVQKICSFLKIPLEVVDLRREFEEKIISYFKESYRRGLTPNPCIICNRELKFGLLFSRARALGAQKLATGHYVRTSFNRELGCFELLKGRDRHKDQSYFLALLTQQQLASAVFPLGDWEKEEVIKESVKLGLFNLTSPESQEICFIRGDYRSLFQAEDFPPGEMVTVDGRVVGRHRGLYAYTIGQRRGLGVRLGRPYYVVAIDAFRNRIIIGPKKFLKRRRFLVKSPHFICPAYRQDRFEALVRIRYRHQEAPAEIILKNDAEAEVTFKKPQQAITPGQFAVFYQGEKVMGGGEIRLPGGFTNDLDLPD